MQQGATALVHKPFDKLRITEVVERAISLSGERFVKQQRRESIRQRLATLTAEEQSVLDLLLKGLPNKGVALALQISMRTLDRRRLQILAKMQVGSLLEVVLLLGELEAE